MLSNCRQSFQPSLGAEVDAKGSGGEALPAASAFERSASTGHVVASYLSTCRPDTRSKQEQVVSAASADKLTATACRP